MKKRTMLALGVGGVIVIAGIASTTGGGSNSTGHETTTDHSTGRVKPHRVEEEPQGPATSFTDGTFLVGSDIASGTYKSKGPGSTDILDSCYWERASDDSGDFESITSNDNITGPGRVTVKSGEVFKTSGGCKWKLVR